MIDAVAEIEIARPRAEVAAFALDQDNAPGWRKNVESVEWETGPPAAVGARFTFVATVLGGVAYTYEVHELVAGERFVMSTTDGPFEMQTSYTWSDAPGGGTLMTLRNSGEPKNKLSAPLMERALARASRKDLRRLKKLLESG